MQTNVAYLLGPIFGLFSSISVKKSKTVSKRYALNFGATGLPQSSYELSYYKLSMGSPEVGLVSAVWRSGPSKIRKARFLTKR